MKTENWVKTETLGDYHKKAILAAKKRKQWEEEQLKQGKKEKLIPHPTLLRTFILKFE